MRKFNWFDGTFLLGLCRQTPRKVPSNCLDIVEDSLCRKTFFQFLFVFLFSFSYLCPRLSRSPHRQGGSRHRWNEAHEPSRLSLAASILDGSLSVGLERRLRTWSFCTLKLRNFETSYRDTATECLCRWFIVLWPPCFILGGCVVVCLRHWAWADDVAYP